MTASFPAAIWDGDTPNIDHKHQVKKPEGTDWDRLVDEVIAAQTAIKNGFGTAGAAAGTGNVASEVAPNIQKTVLTLTGLSLSVASTAVGFASQKIYDFPDGNIQVLGAVAALTLTTVGANIDADADVLIAVGSAACADDATLTSTEANVIPSTTFALVGSTKTGFALSTAVAVLDGVTSAAADLYLNMVVPDADRTDTAQAVTVTGTITITWINLGDA